MFTIHTSCDTVQVQVVRKDSRGTLKTTLRRRQARVNTAFGKSAAVRARARAGPLEDAVTSGRTVEVSGCRGRSWCWSGAAVALRAVVPDGRALVMNILRLKGLRRERQREVNAAHRALGSSHTASLPPSLPLTGACLLYR